MSFTACIKWINIGSPSFKPTLIVGLLLASSQVDCTNPCIASLILLALDLVIGPSETCKGSLRLGPLWFPSDSLQQVIEFYKHYAYSKGFATMTRNSRKNKGFSETSYINLKCNREGRYSSLVDDPSKKRSTIKNACEARIKASMDVTDKKWRILSFIEEHNHDLSPSKSRHFAAFRHISTDTRRKLLINDNAGVRINSSIKASIVEAGGYENVTYNQRDVRNFLEKERRLKCKEGDGQALHDYFVRIQAKNSNFYHALDLDDELRV
jgi:zinc finger SWIM domain-containing protein 3